MPTPTDPLFTVTFSINDRGVPVRKMADAEIVFTDAAGPLAGLKLIGFTVWERAGSAGGFTVTLPARQYAVNGERRAYALLRPAASPATTEALTAAILEAYHAYGDALAQIGGEP
jgi:hypothetical protein